MAGSNVAYVVATGLVSVPVPGVWRRLGLIANDGKLSGFDERQLVGQLEELGIPRHHYGVVRAVRSWRSAAVPPDVAFALWPLRECVPNVGGLPRRRGSAVEDTGPTIRYLQLALAAGELTETDPAIATLAGWLVESQLEDGSIRASFRVAHGEVGSTARAMRVLSRIRDERIRESVELMRRFLIERCLSASGGRAWSYGHEEPTPVTGASSLAGLALLESGADKGLLAEIAGFLLAAQDRSGGWSEVPGYEPTIHNTFNVARYLRAARHAGIVGAEADEALARTARWFLRQLRWRAPRTILDLAYAIRLAVQLNLCRDRRVEQLARRLCRQRSLVLAPGADLYAETEITAIALMELSRHLDTLTDVPRWCAWRWTLPALPPPFLCRTAYLYELLYGLSGARWWMRTVDFLVNAAIIDRAAGLLLGTVAALGFVDDFVTAAMTNLGNGVRGIVAIVLIGCVSALWLAVKSCAYSSLLRAARTSVWSLIAGALLTWIVLTPAPVFPSLLALVALRWLVIDVIAHTADASGLLNRMLPR